MPRGGSRGTRIMMISGFAQTTPLTRSPLPLFLPIPTFCVPVVLPSFALYRFTSCMHVGLFSFYVDVALSRGLRITPAGIDRMGNTSRSGWHTTWEWLRGLHWASILLLPFCFTSLLLSFLFLFLHFGHHRKVASDATKSAHVRLCSQHIAGMSLSKWPGQGINHVVQASHHRLP